MRELSSGVVRELGDLPEQSVLHGNGKVEMPAEPALAIQTIGEAASTGTLIELQFFSLVIIYLSETVASALYKGTHQQIFKVWHDGDAERNIRSFRVRFAESITGVYETKKKKGSRKTVISCAKTAVEIVGAEIRLIHNIRQMAIADQLS